MSHDNFRDFRQESGTHLGLRILSSVSHIWTWVRRLFYDILENLTFGSDMSRDMSCDMSRDMSRDMSCEMSCDMSGDISCNISRDMSCYMSHDMSFDMSRDM